jgi:hypothetical protein
VTSVAPPPAPIPVPAVTNTLTPEQRQVAIDTETDRLQQWSMSDDPASLSNILADLTNSEKEVREAAIEAAKQFGSINAIPTLKDMAANDEDPEEKAALLEAADYLALPSFTFGGSGTGTPATPEQIQIDQQARAEHDAHRQAQIQKHATDQNAQPTPDQNTTPPPGHNSPAPPNQ